MKRRDTGPSKPIRAFVGRRAGDRCERCRFRWGQQVHHRRPRQMGGDRRPETNKPANLVLLCRDCHDSIESNRTKAYVQGWLVHQTRTPADVPIHTPRGQVWLTNETEGAAA